MACDLKLVGGEVLDGSGTPATRADVAIERGVISAIGELSSLESARTIDCAGKTITPGFIDIHSHTDWLLPEADHPALVEPFIRQGMTSLVAGNCGFSPAPITDRNRDAVHDSSRLVVDDSIELGWQSMGEFLSALERKGVALNVAQLVGHGTVRAAVSGHLDPAVPNPDQLAQMERFVREALDEGCVGVSTGLGYPPGIFAQHDELVAFAKWAAAADKLFTSHLKAYSKVSGAYQTDPEVEWHNLAAIREILEVAEASRARLQISHLIFVGRKTWPSHLEAIAKIERARASGIDVAFDAFPYTAGNTTASVLFPPEILPHLETILADANQRAAIAAFADAAFDQIGFGLADIQIMRANVDRWNQYDGLRVTDAAEREGVDPFDFFCRMVIESQRTARVLIHTYSGDGDEEQALRAVIAHPLCTVETDTFVTRRGHQNAASYGTFSRVISTYVREGLLSLPEAVRKMTGAVADRLGWKDRGFVRKGAAADLVVLDTGRLDNQASLDRPAIFPRGIEHVFVNGHHLLAGERYAPDGRAGRVLRS